jgi:hypothetical protein
MNNRQIVVITPRIQAGASNNQLITLNFNGLTSSLAYTYDPLKTLTITSLG